MAAMFNATFTMAFHNQPIHQRTGDFGVIRVNNGPKIY